VRFREVKGLNFLICIKSLDNAYKKVDYMYMRTTLDISDALVNEAMLLTKIPTKTGLIKYALENVIQREKVKELTNYFGKVNLDIDLNKMRKR
jgi:Arc/MetJ family transcription regulator